jgi:hypothetical protein
MLTCAVVKVERIHINADSHSRSSPMEAFGKEGQHAPMVAPTYDIDRREVSQWIEALALDVGL